MNITENPGSGVEPWLVLLLMLGAMSTIDWGTLEHSRLEWVFILMVGSILLMGMIFLHDQLFSQ